jgi:hypothetical protein
MSDPRPIDRGPANLFLAYLRELPLGAWVRATKATDVGSEFTNAHSALHAALRECHERGAVFGIRDAVFDALHRFEAPEGRRLTRVRHVADNLLPGTERAALAVLMRPQLTQAEFEVLYAGFAEVIPSVLLFGLGA